MEWIKVSDKLPPLPDKRCGGVRYLCCIKSSMDKNRLIVTECSYTVHGEWHVNSDPNWIVEPVYWMPLPKPPKN